MRLEDVRPRLTNSRGWRRRVFLISMYSESGDGAPSVSRRMRGIRCVWNVTWRLAT